MRYFHGRVSELAGVQVIFLVSAKKPVDALGDGVERSLDLFDHEALFSERPSLEDWYTSHIRSMVIYKVSRLDQEREAAVRLGDLLEIWVESSPAQALLVTSSLASAGFD